MQEADKKICEAEGKKGKREKGKKGKREKGKKGKTMLQLVRIETF
ncbi:hypothetical protein [Stutzerimonas kunmingensis]|nr:hypothetical protein [Stutzerimonas kunmingensis]